MCRFLLIPAIAIIWCSTLCAQTPLHFEVPNLSHLEHRSFWATSYWVHHANSLPEGIPLRDDLDKELGPVLSQKDWCLAALEGTVRINGTTYNYSTSGKSDHVDCRQFFKPDVGYSRFKVSKSTFGYGVEGYVLVPYRTIAAAPNFLKPGTVLFIPTAVGQKLPDGSRHDGYFFVADKGGSIRGNHIDVFQGDEVVPFSFIRSKDTFLFIGYVVVDPKTIAALEAIHRLH